jgi:hypothetical protein
MNRPTPEQMVTAALESIAIMRAAKRYVDTGQIDPTDLMEKLYQDSEDKETLFFIMAGFAMNLVDMVAEMLKISFDEACDDLVHGSFAAGKIWPKE